MLRTLLALAALALALSAWHAPHARADLPKLALHDLSTSFDADAARRELGSIDSESTAATVTYAIAVPLHLLGVGSTVFGGVILAANGGLSGLPFILGGLLGAAVGLVGIAVGIGLDVDSGSRRAGLRRRTQGASAQLLAGPTPDGFTLGLAGTF